MPEKISPMDSLFSQNERALMEQARQIGQGANPRSSETSKISENSASNDLVRARLRNLIAKYQEMAKRERMRAQAGKSTERVEHLQRLLDTLSPPS